MVIFLFASACLFTEVYTKNVFHFLKIVLNFSTLQKTFKEESSAFFGVVLKFVCLLA